MTDREFTYRSSDGLQLFAREWGKRPESTPLLCLAGLTRNSRDFEPLAAVLGSERFLIAPDYRGRGRSEYASDPATYSPLHELQDAITLLDYSGLSRVCVVGTSRGGIIAMLMAALHPDRVAGVVLNDIGPEIEASGLARIALQIAQPARFADLNAALPSLKASNPGLESLSNGEWEAFADRVLRQENQELVADYDSRIALTFPSIADIEAGRVTQLWSHFAQLKNKPCAVLRGQYSDLLSEDIVQRMQSVHPFLVSVTVRNRGHVPFLDEPESLSAIRSIAAACDAA